MPCFGGKLLSIFNKQSISTLDIGILFDINSGWTNKSWNNGYTSSSYREHRSFFTMLRLSTQWCFCRQYSADSTFRVFLWCHFNLSNHMTWGKWRSIANCKRPIKHISWLSRMFSDNSEKSQHRSPYIAQCIFYSLVQSLQYWALLFYFICFHGDCHVTLIHGKLYTQFCGLGSSGRYSYIFF